MFRITKRLGDGFASRYFTVMLAARPFFALLFFAGLSCSSQVHIPANSNWNCYEVAVDDNGEDLFTVVWSRRTLTAGVIEGIILRAGNNEGIHFQTSLEEADVVNLRPAVCWLGSERFLVAWQRDSGSHKRVVARAFRSDGTPDTPVFPVNDTSVAAFAFSPDAQKNRWGEVLVTWQDFRNGNADVFIQFFDSSLAPIGTNARINDDDGLALQGNPTISRNNHERFLLFWPDNRNFGEWNFFSQVLTSDGPEGGNFLVDATQKKHMTIIVNSAWISERDAAYVWKDYRESTGAGNIYRKDARIGEPVPADAFKVNLDPTTQWHRLPSIDADTSGRSLMCWEDYRHAPMNNVGSIYTQAFEGGMFRGGNVLIVENETVSYRYPRLAVSPSGMGLVAFLEITHGVYHVGARWSRIDGDVVGEAFHLSAR